MPRIILARHRVSRPPEKVGSTRRLSRKCICIGAQQASVLGPNKRRRRPRSEATLSPQRLDGGHGEILRICLKTRICANHCPAGQPGSAFRAGHAATGRRRGKRASDAPAHNLRGELKADKFFLFGFVVTH
jgi:hypothetical protein